jgi:CheY-like chemotaxis protein
MEADVSFLRTEKKSNQADRPMAQYENGADFTSVLELANLVAANIRKSAFCAQRHRECLEKNGETAGRLRGVDQWRDSSEFTEKERAAMDLSESISLQQEKESLEKVLSRALSHFSIAEMVSLTLSITAVNDWLDFRSEPDLRVLVVEDNPNDQELLRIQLRRAQIDKNVIFVPNGYEALILLEGYKNGAGRELIALFLDIHLPGMTGIELLRRIRKMPEVADLPVIMMTSSNDPRDIEECHRLKVSSYVQKPVTFKSFSQAIANIFHLNGAPCSQRHGKVE